MCDRRIQHPAAVPRTAARLKNSVRRRRGKTVLLHTTTLFKTYALARGCCFFFFHHDNAAHFLPTGPISCLRQQIQCLAYVCNTVKCDNRGVAVFSVFMNSTAFGNVRSNNGSCVHILPVNRECLRSSASDVHSDWHVNSNREGQCRSVLMC